MATTTRFLLVLGCLPLILFPGLCTGKAGWDCGAAHESQHEHGSDGEPGSHDAACAAIEVDHAVVAERGFESQPPEPLAAPPVPPAASVDPLQPVSRFALFPVQWPPGPPRYVYQRSLLI